MNNEVVFLDQNNIDLYIDIPDFHGNLSPHKVIWISLIEYNYFEVSLRSKEGGYNIWLVRVDNKEKYIPLSCTSWLIGNESQKYALAQKLNLKPAKIMDMILKARIQKDRSQLCQNQST